MKAKALEILITIALLFAVFGCKDEAEASGTTGAIWVFEGTFCSDCNKLYNYIEHPETCDKCGAQTKDFYYLCLIKERK